MKIIEIDGGHKLTGSIRVSGAKNATVALIPAAVLSDEEVTICNVPEITDTDALCDILKSLNVGLKRASESILINAENMEEVNINTIKNTIKQAEEFAKNKAVDMMIEQFSNIETFKNK